MKPWTMRAAPTLAAAAAVIHAVEAPRHFAEWWGYGVFFLIATLAQAVLALLLLRFGRLTPRARAALIAAGIAGNLAVIGLFAVTRTVGIPLAGPSAGELEPITRSGLAATLIELVLVGVLVLVHRTVDAPMLEATTGRRRRAAAEPRSAPPSMFGAAAGALVALLGSITIDALPGVIAAQEGGMGPGSALLLGQAVQLACWVVGAALSLLAASNHSRWMLTAPGMLLILAVGSVALNEHADLGWIALAQALAGLALGWLMTAALLRTVPTLEADRPLALALVLLAPVVARGVTGWLERSGLIGLSVAALATLVIAQRIDAQTPDRPARHGREARARVTPSAVLGVLAVSAGLVAALAGVDPSRVLPTMLIGPFGALSLDAIDASRATFLVIGIVLLIAGAGIVATHVPLQPRLTAAVLALALISLAASGAGTLLAAAAPAEGIMLGERAVSLVTLVGLMGTGAGIALATLASIARRRPALTAAIGATGLAIVSGISLVVLTADTANGAAAVLSAPLGLAGGLTAAALWLALLGAAPSLHAVAAAVGTAATTVGLALGPSVARAQDVGGAGGFGAGAASGAVVIAIASVAALSAVVMYVLLGNARRSLRRRRLRPA
jgi:hypothetical protein